MVTRVVDTIPDEQLESLERSFERIDVLQGRVVRVSVLHGGLTNHNYRVDTDTASYVVRVSPLVTEGLVIDRDHEYRNSVIAASSGVGAPVIDHLPDQRTMVIGFIEGVTLTDDSFSARDTVERVAAACRRLHGGPPFVSDFDMFDIQAGYLGQVLEHGYRLPDGYLDHAAAVERIRRALAVRAEPVVACHNDLLAGNFVDDGRHIRIIDYEYAGNNDPCFELGNIWSECHLTLDQLEELVSCYYGRRRVSRLARARLHGLMSQYGWTLWASIQHATSRIEFDYWSWGMEKYDRAVATFHSPEVDRLIEQAQEAD
jgi:thiamine kinase-like enzyme